MVAYKRSATLLRQELATRNHQYATRLRLTHVSSLGPGSIVVYPPTEDGNLHGNFNFQSYTAILKDQAWLRRLNKSHTHKKELPQPDSEMLRPWCELDTCTSSDALLMNIFCFPGVLENREAASLLGIRTDKGNGALYPYFGFKARVPRTDGTSDATEIDMRLDDLLVEAKLTESNFQRKDVAVVERYRDFDVVFDRDALPLSKPKRRIEHDHDLGEILVEIPGQRYESYQMIRNILAAHAHKSRLCVLIHECREDLLEQYYAVLRAVRDSDLRTRCTILTWQELSGTVPARLKDFLSEKYGIHSR